MKKKNIFKILLIMVMVFSLTGCTKILKDKDGKVVKNEITGQSLTSNILCRPSEAETIKMYEQSGVKLKNYPKCSEFKVTSGGYEGIWTTIFVKPLALLIVKTGEFVKNYGLAIMLITLLIRLVMYPLTQKTALQSENMKIAQPELARLEKKYANKDDKDSMMMKSQEMLGIYKKYNINPMSGCLFSFIQIPLFFAFYEALNRLPVIFEGTFLGLNMGMSPVKGLASGNYIYLIIILLVVGTTYFSMKLNSGASMSPEQASQMKMMTNIMVVMISVASFSISAGIAIYWITNSGFTIIQNLIAKRRKAHVK